MAGERTAQTDGTNVRSPEDLHPVFVEAFNTGSVEAVLSLYEQDAVLVPQPGEVASGHAAIAAALERFQAVGKMAAETRYCIDAGDVALASATWEIKGIAPDGKPVEVRGTSADLIRRQADGHWLLVVDHPFGGS